MWRSLLRLPPVAFVWGVVDTYNRLGVARPPPPWPIS